MSALPAAVAAQVTAAALPRLPGDATISTPAGTTLHIVLAGHIAGDDVKDYLAPGQADSLPTGYLGAPLMGILIGELLRLGHRVTAITTDPTLPAHPLIVLEGLALLGPRRSRPYFHQRVRFRSCLSRVGGSAR